MPPLSKPYRCAVLLPEVAIEGPEGAVAHELALVVWSTCIDLLQRHPGLAVYDADATPLVPRDGHFAPEHAARGALPTDAYFAPTRRDELVWLELALPRGPARLHALTRTGEREVFDASGRNIGEQLNQLLSAWLAARKLAPLARRCEPVTVEELLAIARAMAPAFAEQARNWVMPSAGTPAWLDRGDEEDAQEVDLDHTIDQEPVAPAAPGARPRVRIARQIANKLPRVLRAPALRLLELALHDDLADLILEVDPEHPQALFAKLAGGEISPADHFPLLRRVIASAPGWARPYSELAADRAAAPSPLEITSGTGIAALCRPGELDVVDAAARQLCVDGRADEAVRLMTRAVRVHAADPTAHVALLHVHAATDRVGAWLAQAQRSARAHGCPAPGLPWYPDQIHIDLLLADALLACGRLDEAIALRANRLAGREATWPRHVRTLATWRKDPRYAAWCHAREGAFRGDPARVLAGFGRIEPDDSLDVAMLLDALVALGRESEAPLAWAHHGLGRGRHGAAARLAAARCLLAAGAWRHGLEELWRVELTEPGRDEYTAIARCGRLLASLPIEVAEAALGERVAIGAITLARRMARDVADFVPAAAKSSIVLRALGRLSKLEFDAAALERFGPVRGRAAIDALFEDARGGGEAPAEPEPRGRGRNRRKPPVEVGDGDALERGDRLVERWLGVACASAGDDEPAALARAAAYVAAQALGRYLCATTAAPSPLTGALRTVAAEALALVGCYRDALGDRDALALLGVLDPLLRRVDRWVGTRWLAAVERACGIDERAHGDVAGFVGEYATVTARILGPEEAAVLACSVARLHRDRPDGWDAATAAQAERIALHTGHAGVDEWAEAIVSQLAARTLDADDAIDMLHTACYLAEGTSALPCVLAARVLFDNGRGPAALAVLTAGLAAARPELRDRELPKLAKPWRAAKLEVPFAFEAVATGLYDALQKGDPARAEKFGRWAVAYDPENAEAHRNLGLALAQQGKLADALDHLVRATGDQATQILASVLYQAGKLPEAMAVLDYASPWYTRAEQWLAYGGIAYAALETARAVKAYGAAYELDQDEFDASQLNAFAGVLDESGEHARCQQVAEHLLRVAGDDATWKTAAWNHLASAYIAQRRFEEAEQLAARALAENPMPDNAAAFQATLERARAKQTIIPSVVQPEATRRDPAFAPLDTGEFEAAAARLADPSWRVRRAALVATRFRAASAYDAAPVPARARAAAERVLADSAGAVDAEAVRCRVLALEIRAQAQFARDPLPSLPEARPAARPFVDRVVVPNTRVARIGEYVALLRDLAALPPREALAQFDLDDAGYLETAKAWASAIEADPTIATMIGIGLAKR